jgi:hypothetical protein
MAEDQRKVWLIAEFLEDSFVGCSVFYDYEDRERVARSYRIVDYNTGKLMHHVNRAGPAGASPWSRVSALPGPAALLSPVG